MLRFFLFGSLTIRLHRKFAAEFAVIKNFENRSMFYRRHDVQELDLLFWPTLYNPEIISRPCNRLKMYFA